LRHCMAGGVEPLWCGQRWERDHSLALQKSKMPKKESPKCERTWGLPKADRRVTQITVEETLSFKLGIISISKSHHSEAPSDFMWKGSWHLHVGPYRICQRIGKLAYMVELPEELIGVHLVFHVSQLCKFL
jgi:hypothetical protein